MKLSASLSVIPAMAIFSLTASTVGAALTWTSQNISGLMNRDVVYEADASSVADTFGAAQFYETGWNGNISGTASGASGSANGLAPNGLYSNTAHAGETIPFQFASYSSNNTIYVTTPNAPVVFDIADGNYAALALAAASGNGDTVMNYTLTYATGSPTTVSVTVADWGLTPISPFEQFITPARYYSGSTGGGWDISSGYIAVDESRVLQSVSFTKTSGGELGIFALSSAVPEPSGMLLLGVAGGLMLRRRRTQR